MILNTQIVSMDYAHKLKWARVTAEQITYIKDNSGRSCRAIAKEIGVSHNTVYNHINGFVSKKGLKKKSERLQVERVITLTDFSTNGNFDIDKWAQCSHV